MKTGAALCAVVTVALASAGASAAARPRPRPHPHMPTPLEIVYRALHDSYPRQVERLVPPWKPNGTSRVAEIRVRRLRVYGRPGARRTITALPNPNRRGTPLVLLVRRRLRGWLNVYLPARPNGSRGWIRRRDARVLVDDYHVIVRVRQHRLEVWRRHRLVTQQTVAVGRRRMPTPHGVFFVVELLRPTTSNGVYGAYSFGLSAHSNVLRRFGGGDGRIGMHGTDTPWLLGRSVSHGCIRMRNRAVRKLARLLPLGTPVLIRS